MDLDPFVPVGIEGRNDAFSWTFFCCYCLLADSPPDSPEEIAALGRNQHRTAARGREDGLLLERDGDVITLHDWASELLTECAPIAEALDAAHGGHAYRDALASANAGLAEPDTLPSARVLAQMQADFDGSFNAFARAQSEATRAQLLALPYPEPLAQRLAAMAESSRAEQRRIEAADSLPFEPWRQAYLDPATLEVMPQAQAA